LGRIPYDFHFDLPVDWFNRFQPGQSLLPLSIKTKPAGGHPNRLPDPAITIHNVAAFDVEQDAILFHVRPGFRCGTRWHLVPHKINSTLERQSA
jgi:hypothetical protein